MSLITSCPIFSKQDFYSDYKKGTHPILNTQTQIESVFSNIDDYIQEESVNVSEKQITRIFIVRHAESEANKLGINAGCMDFPLSEEGRKDAEELGESLAKKMRHLDIDAVYHTSLSRTFETYQHMDKGWEKQQGKKLPLPQIADGLLEKNNGKLEGLRKEEYEPLKKREGQILEEINEFDDLFDYKIPEGGEQYESLHDVWNRAVFNLNEIAQNNPGKNVLVISHVGTMRALIVGGAASTKQPITLNYRKFDIKNGSILAIESNGAGIRVQAVSPFDYEKSKK
jgi:broad specificity phosphatase PhoE